MQNVREILIDRTAEEKSNQSVGGCLGKYTLVKPLGQGGEGCVYLAKDEYLGRFVAIKCIRRAERDTLDSAGTDADKEEAGDSPEQESDEYHKSRECRGENCQDYESGEIQKRRCHKEKQERIMREADYLQQLEHPMLPVVYDLFEDTEGMWYLVMEYIQGINLHEYIERNGFVQEEQARVWAGQLADVLGYLHGNKPPVIYCDLKPENIMVCPGGKLRLVDFGAALKLSFGSERNIAMAVTPGYGAPEQWDGIHEWKTEQKHMGSRFYADERSDIYALGKVLYYMVTGAEPSRPPYTALPVYEYQPLLGDDLEMIIRKCIRQEPDQRYQTAEEVKKDLSGGDRRRRMRRKSFIKVVEKRIWLTEGGV